MTHISGSTLRRILRL